MITAYRSIIEATVIILLGVLVPWHTTCVPHCIDIQTKDHLIQ